MLTDSEWKEFYNGLDELENIYDLLVLLYLQIDGKNKPCYIKEYYKSLERIPEGYWGDLPLIINELLMGGISFEFFIKEFRKCVNMENLRNVAIRMLFSFDRYFQDRQKYSGLELSSESCLGKVYNFGPFNKAKSEYNLYLMPDYHYFKDFNKKNQKGIRFLPQSQFNAIDKNITHYKIIKKDRLNQQIKIKYYDKTFEKMNKCSELKIGIVPVSKILWSKVLYQELGNGERNYFQLENVKKHSKNMNEAYIRILKRCIEEKIQIVIIPELARNEETEKTIKEFLSQETLRNPNSLKLVFMGSLWKNGTNEGILFSGTGIILMKSRKIEPFSLKHQNKLYWEDLREEEQEIQLLDMPGLGRIQYLVCKDALHDGLQHDMWGLFEIALSFVSSYSNSISYFKQLGSSFASQYAGIYVLSNACAARIGIKHANREKELGIPQTEIGHITAPCSKDDKGTATSKEAAYCEMEHCWLGCRFGGCIRVFKINLSQMHKGAGALDDYIETDCIIL